MKNLFTPVFLFKECLLLSVLLLSLTGCSTFPKGYRLMIEDEIKQAKDIYRKNTRHGTYGPGAVYYLEALSINSAADMPEWTRMHRVFCDLEEEVRQLSGKKLRKLYKYKVTPGRIRQSAEKLEARILEEICTDGKVVQLESLYNDFPCWHSKQERDSVRDIVVNKTIDPDMPVYDKKECRDWTGGTGTPPDEKTIWGEKGWCYESLTFRKKWKISYEDATLIGRKYGEVVLEPNYPTYWDIQDHIWEIFLIYHPYCEMDRFRDDHPLDAVSRDCWFDNARDTLCLGQLRPLLAFHRNNPYTVLDYDVCNQILSLEKVAGDAGQINREERQQIEDIKRMFDLQNSVVCPAPDLDPSDLIAQVAQLAGKYAQHRVVYDLAKRVSNYLISTGRVADIKLGLETFRPLFPDTASCSSTNFYFQTGKQKWFNNLATLLEREGDRIVLPKPETGWNTPDNDEYGLVSWGETREVFFVRRDPNSRSARIMTSRLDGEQWTKPIPVPELSISSTAVPLSVSADGRFMLLQSKGKLLQSYRHNINRLWSKPEPIPASFSPEGKASLYPNGTTLLTENYSGRKVLGIRPGKDIFYSPLGPNGRFGKPATVGETVNLPWSDEGAPLMALGNRLLFFTSDNPDGLGESDMYSVALTKPGVWETAAEPVNLGLGLNTIYDDNGLTYYSEYSGIGYFDRQDRCNENVDIWSTQLGKEAFPQHTIRFAGLVLNENRKPIGGGFMEFTTDYNLKVHSQAISPNGTYFYTTPDSSEVVRLFPEIPGYYSEHDTKHFLDNTPRGMIIRDTFILTSFEYIRQHFKLHHSTFVNGSAEFDNPEATYPELTRLARIATRMGAELELSGHTDGTGAESTNQELSADRAQSVKRFLVEKCGFNPDKVRVFGYGPTRPICPNDTEEGRRCNRRVEVVFKMPVLPSERIMGTK